MKLDITTIINITDATLINPPENMAWERIEIDSRRVDATTYFLPILGEIHDGHKFIESAFSKGATVSFCERAYFYAHYKQLKSYTLLLVDNTTKALHRLTRYCLEKTGVKVIGITGSVGKTSTKEFVYHVLKQQYAVHKNKGNFNNHIGLPLTVLDLEEDHQVAVLEMGMNHFKEIETLVAMARPDIGLITNIGTSHIGILGSQENIFQAKMEMVTYFDDENTLIVNGTDPYLETVDSEIFKVIQSGVKSLVPYDIRLESNSCYSYAIDYKEQSFRIHLNVLGRHNITNSLLAIHTGLELGVPMEDIVKGLGELVENNKRLQILKGMKGCQIISDCYNASQESMISALEVLNSQNPRRKIAVLGDVLELGDFAKSSHEQVGHYIAAHPVDSLLTFGKDSIHIGKQAIKEGMAPSIHVHFKDKDVLVKHLKAMVDGDDIVLVKGSLGMGMQSIVEALHKE